jgi:hypothetical protein
MYHGIGVKNVLLRLFGYTPVHLVEDTFYRAPQTTNNIED